jgi:hypothetical protein
MPARSAFNNGSSAVEVFEGDHVVVVNNSSYQEIITPVLSGRGKMKLGHAAALNVVSHIFFVVKKG